MSNSDHPPAPCRGRGPQPHQRRATVLAVGRTQLWANSRGADSRSAEEGQRARNWVRYRGACHLLRQGAAQRLSGGPVIPTWPLAPALRRIATDGLANMRAPVAIDVRRAVWGVEDDASFGAIISVNMVHIAPWEATLGLLRRRGPPLESGRGLFFYGSFILGRTHTAASHAVFDQTSRGGTPCGVRDVDDLVGEAAPHGLELREVVAMPANTSLVFVKAGSAVPADISRELHGRATPPAATSIDPDGEKSGRKTGQTNPALPSLRLPPLSKKPTASASKSTPTTKKKGRPPALLEWRVPAVEKCPRSTSCEKGKLSMALKCLAVHASPCAWSATSFDAERCRRGQGMTKKLQCEAMRA
jgi:hypothetical protein